MATAEDELDRFTQYARTRISNSGTEMSLDELFDLWRSENPKDDSYSENVGAIAVAIEDFLQGDRGTLAGEHSDALRREFGIDSP